MSTQQHHHNSQQKRRHIKKRRNSRRRRVLLYRRLIVGGFAIITVLALSLLISHAFKGKKDPADKETKKVSSVTVKNEKDKEGEEKVKEASATILTAGDIIVHKPFLTSSQYLRSDGTYDYNSIFTYVKDDYEAADFTVTTVEGALTEGNYSGYPMFCSPDAVATTLSNNGVDMCLLANNHIYYNFDNGLQRTMDVMTANSLLYTGLRKTTADKPYLIQEINGIKVGFFNYVFETERVNGQKTINGIAVSDESSELINSFNSQDLDSFYSKIETGLQEMKEEDVEFTIVYMHWGIEYQTTESAEQDAMAQKLCDLGVDALIGSHPHVIQPVDLLASSDGSHQMLCAYAIGNLLSNQRTEYMDGLAYGHTEDGVMLELTIQRDSERRISITKADFTPTWVAHFTNNDAEYYILPVNEPENLPATTGMDVTADARESLERTNAIIGAGVQKVQNALPILENK